MRAVAEALVAAVEARLRALVEALSNLAARPVLVSELRRWEGTVWTQSLVS